MVYIWLGVTVLALVVEGATKSLVSIWCAAGALVTLFAAYFGLSLQGQVLLFVSLSVLGAAVARPLAKRYTEPRMVPTNADRVLGMEARVTETINNEYPTGAVYVDGKTWTARSADGEVIPKGETVEVQWMEGVKLIVRSKAAVPAA
ncbi:MAG: NfeD family protein [Oscillospiraceae bacterium]|nr:NfeD family protein [Oscillospiraceae bacterium]